MNGDYISPYTEIVDKMLLEIIINTKDINILVSNCKFNKTIDRVCRENQDFIGSEILKKRGYIGGNYSLFKRFFKLDDLFQRNVKNIIKLYNKNDMDLLEIILNVNYNNLQNNINFEDTVKEILNIIYEQNNTESKLFMKFIHWDLFETKHTPNEKVFKNLFQEHNKLFNQNYSLNEYIILFTSKINEKINFTNITSLETKIAIMMRNWDYWINNPAQFTRK